MKTYEVSRTDYYLVTFEAKNLKEAKKKIEEDDDLLNSGSFFESQFGEVEEQE